MVAFPHNLYGQTLCQQLGQEPFNPDVTIGTNAGSITTTSSLGITGWSGKRIRIHGQLIADSDFSIQACTLSMQPGSLIEARFNTWVNIGGSRFFCCNGMWTGLRVATSHIGFLALLGNQIEDAQRALDVQSAASSLTILSNRFNRNTRGIVVDGVALNAVVAFNQLLAQVRLTVSRAVPAPASRCKIVRPR